MNGRWKSGILAAAGLFLLISPVFALLGAWLQVSPPSGMLLLPAAAVAAVLITMVFPKKLRLPVLAFAMLTVALSGFILLNPLGWRLALPLLTALALMPRLLYALSRPAGSEWPAAFLVAGMALHLIAQVFLRWEAFRSAAQPLDALFIAYFLYFILTLNRMRLEQDIGGSGHAPRLIVRRNQISVFFVGLAAVIAANISAVLRVVSAALAFIRKMIGYLLVWFAGLLPAGDPQGNPLESSAPDLGGLPAPGEPSAFAQFLEKAAGFLAAALLSVLAVFTVVQLYKLLKKAVRALLAWLRRYLKHVSEAYEDSVESLITWGDIAKAIRAKSGLVRLRHGKPRAWRNMDSRERVRNVFLQLKSKVPPVSVAATARELLTGGSLPVESGAAPRMADIYDAARYSQCEILPDDAEYMRENAKL